jgi:hypothetical protein
MTELSLRSRRPRSSAWLASLAVRDEWPPLWISVAALILAAGELTFLWPDIDPARWLMLIPLWALSLGACRMAIAEPGNIG